MFFSVPGFVMVWVGCLTCLCSRVIAGFGFCVLTVFSLDSLFEFAGVLITVLFLALWVLGFVGFWLLRVLVLRDLGLRGSELEGLGF